MWKCFHSIWFSPCFLLMFCHIDQFLSLSYWLPHVKFYGYFMWSTSTKWTIKYVRKMVKKKNHVNSFSLFVRIPIQLCALITHLSSKKGLDILRAINLQHLGVPRGTQRQAESCLKWLQGHNTKLCFELNHRAAAGVFTERSQADERHKAS